MWVHHVVHAEDKTDEKYIRKYQHTRGLHMGTTKINQQVVDVPTIGFEWRVSANNASSEHPEGIKKWNDDDANGDYRAARESKRVCGIQIVIQIDEFDDQN